MTIAACYVSPEGVVLGADSTSTYYLDGGPHYYNNAQKLFELGNGTTWGVVTWGLGGLAIRSYRTLLAVLSDDLAANPPATPQDIADRWAAQFWAAYSGSPIFAPYIQRYRELHELPLQTTAPRPRDANEEEEYTTLRSRLIAGFCVGGYKLPEREPAAFEIIVDPAKGAPTAIPLPQGFKFWGAPNMIQRLIFGCDDTLKGDLLQSGNWTGTEAELAALIGKQQLAHPTVPIRDAIDFIHACIYSTIKALKFSSLSQICGGPIELAVITTDREFRWVRHKPWDAAITEGDT